MLVSTCRLDLQPDLRRGYVLHITNLEDRPLRYLVSYVLTVPVSLMGGVIPHGQQLDQFVRFTGNSWVQQSFRIVGGLTHLPAEGGIAFIASVNTSIGPRQTGRVGMEPSVPTGGLAGLFSALGGRRTDTWDHLEGYVTLRLPALRQTNRQFFTAPQSTGPVRVLVNPETRTLYRTGGQRVDIWDDDPPLTIGGGLWGPPIDPPPVKRGFTYAPSATIERTEPLHVATGKAENELMPEGVKSLTVESLNYALDAVNAETTEAGDYQGAGPVADEDRAGALIELLLEVGDDAELARAVNKVLEDHQASVRIRKP